MRPRRGRGLEESCRCGIGRGEFKQGPRNGETEAGKFGFGSAIVGTDS